MQLCLDLVNSQCCRSIWFLFYLRVMFILNCWVNVKFMLWSGSYAKTECQVLTSHMIIHYSTAYQWVLWLSFIKIQRSDRDYQQVSSPENYQFGVQKWKRLIIKLRGMDCCLHGYFYSWKALLIFPVTSLSLMIVRWHKSDFLSRPNSLCVSPTDLIQLVYRYCFGA